MSCGHALDKRRVRQSFAAAATGYDAVAGLQRTVAGELLQKFPPQPVAGRVLDLGCGTGFLTRLLARAAAGEAALALDIALPMLAESRRLNAGLPVQYLCADAETLPFAARSFRQVYSSLALQWCQNLPAVLADCHRLLLPGGQLVFATFGPATLTELKAAWAAADDYPHVSEFLGVAHIRESLRAAGFAEILSAEVLYSLNYPSVLTLMQELKQLGAHNARSGRNRGLTTRRQLQRMIDTYAAATSGNGITATYEILYFRGLA